MRGLCRHFVRADHNCYSCWEHDPWVHLGNCYQAYTFHAMKSQKGGEHLQNLARWKTVQICFAKCASRNTYLSRLFCITFANLLAAKDHLHCLPSEAISLSDKSMGIDPIIYPIYHYLLTTSVQYHQLSPLSRLKLWEVNGLIFEIFFFFSSINLHYLSDIFTDIWSGKKFAHSSTDIHVKSSVPSSGIKNKQFPPFGNFLSLYELI